MTSAYELRRRARESLGGKIFGKGWLYPLLVSLIMSAIFSAVSYTFILGFIAAGVIYFGTAKYYLETSRGRNNAETISIAFDGLKQDLGGNIILGILQTLFIFLWSLLFVVPSIVKSYSYAMAYYIKADHPELTPTQALDESRRIMNGNKWRLFCLDLSFIGWLIVGALCLGIGTLWVTAYMEMARAEFYRDLVADGFSSYDGDKFDEFIESL